MAGPPRHAMQQEGSAGNGFHAAVGIGQATEQAPPVVNQSNTARHHTAPLQVVGGEATPTPLVLDLVEPHFRRPRDHDKAAPRSPLPNPTRSPAPHTHKPRGL